VNKDNILAVADAIEKHSIPDLGFNMALLNGEGSADLSGHECGTVACIAGWTCAVAKIAPSFEGAREFLGLERKQSSVSDYHNGNLFFPDLKSDHWDATPSQAVAVLRHLAETGIVDWSVASKALADAVGE
jgi:hypothetical protein